MHKKKSTPFGTQTKIIGNAFSLVITHFCNYVLYVIVTTEIYTYTHNNNKNDFSLKYVFHNWNCRRGGALVPLMDHTPWSYLQALEAGDYVMLNFHDCLYIL